MLLEFKGVISFTWKHFTKTRNSEIIASSINAIQKGKVDEHWTETNPNKTEKTSAVTSFSHKLCTGFLL